MIQYIDGFCYLGITQNRDRATLLFLLGGSVYRSHYLLLFASLLFGCFTGCQLLCRGWLGREVNQLVDRDFWRKPGSLDRISDDPGLPTLLHSETDIRGSAGEFDCEHFCLSFYR